MIQRGIKVVWSEMPCPALPDDFLEWREKDRLALGIHRATGKEHIITLNPNRLVPILKQQKRSTTCDFENARLF